MIYLLDTTAISDWMNENPKLRSRVAALTPNDRIAVCTISRGEVLFGIARLPDGRRRRKLAGNATTAFGALSHESIPEFAGDRYAQLKVEQQRKGLSLDENDLWIAATAMVIGATLVSRDGDFGRIDGFAVEDWSR